MAMRPMSYHHPLRCLRTWYRLKPMMLVGNRFQSSQKSLRGYQWLGLV
uniref:Uncharacterized protein n=1 Tax=Arundo donax TaxID=35708 RepID=A0A0A8YU53_ARUDO